MARPDNPVLQSGVNALKLPAMIRTRYLKFVFLGLLLCATSPTRGLVPEGTDFAGTWVLKLANRILLAVTLVPVPGQAGTFTGWLARPRHFSVGGAGEYFSDIKGPPTRYAIIRGSAKGNCLSFTTQNPVNKNDQDTFQPCMTAQGHAALRIELPTFEAWPVTKEVGPSRVATTWEGARTYFLDETKASNSEMRQIFQADQKDRQTPLGKINWAVVGKRDAARRQLVHTLLANGKLHTGKDFEWAAFVFQHGETPDDYLLAHTLAMIAVARGRGTAIWIAAATLDRYLNSVHQPQIYGTRFHFEPEGQVTQEPYDRRLISDALRRDIGVPSQALQEEQRKQYEAQLSKRREGHSSR
jgi:hypothetical protein